jgi:hypothetical protein
LVGDEGFAVDASLTEADANRQRSIAGEDWHREHALQRASRPAKEYLASLDNTAFGAATEVVPKFVSPSDPAAQWTGARKGPAFFAYADNYLIDVQFGVIAVEASRAIRQAEVGEWHGPCWSEPRRAPVSSLNVSPLITADGSAPMLNWLIEHK